MINKLNWLNRNGTPIVLILILILILILGISLISSAYLVNYCGIIYLKSINTRDLLNSACLNRESSIYQQLLGSSDGRYLLGVNSFWQTDLDLAERIFDTNGFKTNFLVSYWLGRINYQQGHLDRAVSIWKNNISFVNGTWDVAKDQVLIEDFDEAIRLYELATQLQPENPEIWLEYGKVLWDVKYKPENQNILSDQELTQAVGNAFNNAVKLAPLNFEGLDRYSWYLYRVENDIDKALMNLLRAWDLGGKDDPWVNYHLGRIYEDQNEAQLANQYYQVAYTLNLENHTLIPNRYAQFLIRSGASSRAIEVIEESLLPVDAENPVHYLHLAILYSERCELEKALEYFTAAEELEPGELPSLYNKAREALATPCN